MCIDVCMWQLEILPTYFKHQWCNVMNFKIILLEVLIELKCVQVNYNIILILEKR